MENYFTDALLYQEAGGIPKEPLPDDDESGNETDSESEAGMPAILIGEPIIACLNNPLCNSPSEDEGEWVINDNISFDYPASVGLFESITDSSLHMPLHKPSASSTPMESAEGAVLVIPPSKEGQLPIIFGRTQPRGPTVADSSSDSDTPQFFHYAQPARHIMKKMGYNLSMEWA